MTCRNSKANSRGTLGECVTASHGSPPIYPHVLAPPPPPERLRLPQLCQVSSRLSKYGATNQDAAAAAVAASVGDVGARVCVCVRVARGVRGGRGKERRTLWDFFFLFLGDGDKVNDEQKRRS